MAHTQRRKAKGLESEREGKAGDAPRVLLFLHEGEGSLEDVGGGRVDEGLPNRKVDREVEWMVGLGRVSNAMRGSVVLRAPSLETSIRAMATLYEACGGRSGGGLLYRALAAGRYATRLVLCALALCGAFTDVLV